LGVGGRELLEERKIKGGEVGEVRGGYWGQDIEDREMSKYWRLKSEDRGQGIEDWEMSEDWRLRIEDRELKIEKWVNIEDWRLESEKEELESGY
jgi:hypothetical protein